MSNSKKTEEEMLDQTFLQDDDMTVITNEGDAAPSAATPSAKPKMNQNLIIAGAVAVAAVGIIGFKMMSGSNQSQQAQQPAQQPIVPLTQNQPSVQPPVAQPETVKPEQLNQQPNIDAATTTPIENAQPPVEVQAQQNKTNELPSIDGGDESLNVKQEGQNLNTQLKIEESNPLAKAVENANNKMNEEKPNNEIKAVDTKATDTKVVDVKQPNINKAEAVVKSNEMAVEVNQNLISQLEETMDKKYNPRFEAIEKSLDGQQKINQSVEERLSRLESGKSTVATSTTETKKIVKKIIRKKPAKVNKESDTLIDNTSKVKVETHASEEILIENVDKAPKEVKPVFPNIEIHSVYSGRVWTKNTDGSLSTFAVGEKLPSGEIIKKIDDETGDIVTNKRTIAQH